MSFLAGLPSTFENVLKKDMSPYAVVHDIYEKYTTKSIKYLH